MKNKFFTTLVAILVLFNVANFVLSYSNSQQTLALHNEISRNPKQPVVYVTGSQGPQGITGSVGPSGEPGINAISFNTTIIKEVPIIQQITNNVPSPQIQQRFNTDNGDFEQKYSNDTIWVTVIPCSKFVNGCINQTDIPANQPVGDLGSS